MWRANEDIHKRMKDLIGKNHPDLALYADQIVVVFREKAGKLGGQVVYGTARKSGSLVNALSGVDYKFVLELGADTWEEGLTFVQKEALLDHLLTACRVETDEKKDTIKFNIARPDLIAYRDNIERYGMWFPKPEDPEAGPVDEVEEAVLDVFGS